MPWEDYEAAKTPPTPETRPAKVAQSGQWQVHREVMKQAVANHRTWLTQRSNYKQPWDFVSLQSWQDVSPDMEMGYAKLAVRFAEIAEKTHTKVILYITAPYSQNDNPVKAPLEPARA